MSSQLNIVFTAFEPSGDAHAAPVIEALLQRQPDARIYAWGGPRMHEAGATLLENTVGDAAMGLSAWRKAAAVRRNVRSLKRWSKQYSMAVHVAVDSPAANFPICRVMKKRGASVVHLVAPQVWAWAPWRVRKLKRRTDLVLCLLPFEEQWLRSRGVPAKFIGHPRMNRELDHEAIQQVVADFPSGSPRLGIFPGSRLHEVKANLGFLSRCFSELQARHSGLCGLIAAADEQVADLIHDRLEVFPKGLHLVVGKTDAVIHWCDLALAVSGTVTLDITRQAKPMIGIYRTGLPAVWLSKMLLTTPYRLLPNIVAQQEVVPEYVPWAGGIDPIVDDAGKVLSDSKVAAIMSEKLAIIAKQFAGHDPATEAAECILSIAEQRQSNLTQKA